MKTDIVYTNQTLFVYFNGIIDGKDFINLKKKINKIIDEYQINDVVFDLKNASYNDDKLNKLLNEYEIINNLVIKK